MSTLSVTNTLANGNNADASQVNTNFNDIVSYVNTNAITKDGALAFTNNISQSAAAPTSAGHLTRRDYVDKYKVVRQKSVGYAAAPPWPMPNANDTFLVFQQDITDPGYSIDLWAVTSLIVSPWTSAGDLQNMFEYRVEWALSTGASTVGAFTAMGALRIPIVVNGQSLCTPTPYVNFPTGAGGFGTNGFMRVRTLLKNIGGATTHQGGLNGFSFDASLCGFTTWYQAS